MLSSGNISDGFVCSCSYIYSLLNDIFYQLCFFLSGTFCVYLAFFGSKLALFMWLSIAWLEYGLNIASRKNLKYFETYLADLRIHGAVSLYAYKKHVYCKSVLR